LTVEFGRIIADRLKTVKGDPRMGGWLKSFARYAMSVAKIGVEQVAKAFSKILSEREANDMARTTAEELWIGGETKGRAEGRAVGKAEAVLTILRTKFSRVSKETEKAVRQMTDPIALDSLIVHATQSNTMDEFIDGLI